MRKRLSVLALALTFVAPVVFAQDAPDPQNGQEDQSKVAAKEFAALDKNHDGKLSRAEVSADKNLPRHFAMLDADKDGKLSEEEFAKHHQM
jgi:Ca2+-binding EF-hand superfamily protein